MTVIVSSQLAPNVQSVQLVEKGADTNASNYFCIEPAFTETKVSNQH